MPAASTRHFERASEVRNVGRCTVFEQPGRAISSALAETSVQRPAEPRGRPVEPRGLERPFPTPQQSQDGSMSETLAGAVFSSQLIELISAWNVVPVNIYILWSSQT